MDGIFSNPGRRIKGWAQALFVIGIVAAVISFIAMVATDDDLFLTALLTAGISVLAAFISSLFLYAFGELVESTQENRDINRQIMQTLQGSVPQVPQAPRYTPVQNVPTAPQSADSHLSDSWYCRACGTSNSNSYSMCKRCGTYRSSN